MGDPRVDGAQCSPEFVRVPRTNLYCACRLFAYSTPTNKSVGGHPPGSHALRYQGLYSRLLGCADVSSLRSLVSLGHIELDLFAFPQTSAALTFDVAVVHEHLRAPVCRDDETEPFRLTEPLHGTLHNNYLY